VQISETVLLLFYLNFTRNLTCNFICNL